MEYIYTCMSANVLLNLLNELRKKIQCAFDKFNNIGACMFPSNSLLACKAEDITI